MFNLKKIVIPLFALIAFVGCEAEKQLGVADAISKSYEISNDMNKSVVNNILKVKPTSVVRVDNKEIWKYEGNVVDIANKLDVTYHNLTIKFVDGKVKNIGTFSCKIPQKVEN